MGTLNADLQSALALLKAGPVVVIIDPDSGSTPVFCESADVQITGERIEGSHPIVGAYEEWVSSEQITVNITTPERSADAFELFQPQGYDYPTSGKWGIGRAAGDSMRDRGKKVVIRPFATMANDTVEVCMWKAIPDTDLSQTMGKDGADALSVTLKSLADASKQDGALHGYIKFGVRA